MTLGSRARAGFAWMAAGEVAQQASQLAIGIVLARLLLPVDFGLIAMAMFVVGLTETLSPAGLAAILVQKADTRQEEWSLVYWLCVAFGLGNAFLAWLIAPVAGTLLGDERVVPLIRALGWLGLFAGVMRAPCSWLTKHLDFRSLAWIEWTGSIVGGLTGILLAARGWGVDSLIVKALVGSALTTLLLHLRCSWRPSLRVDLRALGRIGWPGLWIQASSVLEYLSRRLDDALIGRFVGPSGLGFYTRAYQLMLYPVHNVAHIGARVMFPVLAEMQGDSPRFRAAYVRTLSVVAAATFPLMLGVAVVAEELIGVVYGPRWLPAAAILQILSLVGLIQSIGTTVSWVYLAHGRTALMFKLGMASATVTYSAFLVGLPWGVLGVATAYLCATVAVLPLNLFPACRLVGIRAGEMIRTLRGPLLGAVGMALVVIGVRLLLLRAEAGPAAILVVCAVSGLAVYLPWLWLTNTTAAAEARTAWSHVLDMRAAIRR